MSARVKKDAQTKFDMAAADGETPGNLFLNQDRPTYRSTKGEMVETKVVNLSNNYMYFINVICDGVS